MKFYCRKSYGRQFHQNNKDYFFTFIDLLIPFEIRGLTNLFALRFEIGFNRATLGGCSVCYKRKRKIC